MLTRSAMVACVAAAALSAQGAAVHQPCSAACESCCPMSLVPDGEGWCRRPGASGGECRLRGKCGGTGKACPAVEMPELMKATYVGSGKANPAGGSGRSRMGQPSSLLDLVFLKEQTPAWSNLPGAALVRMPPQLQNVPAMVPKAVLAKDTAMSFRCPKMPFVEVCDAWVFFYHCARSCDAAYQKGLTQQLAAGGWQFTACAPHFSTGVATGYQHEMRSYRKQLLPGETAVVTTEHDTEFVFFALDIAGVQCGAHGKAACDAADGRCKWDFTSAECVANDCRSTSRGPAPPCKECPWNLLEERPGHGPFN